MPLTFPSHAAAVLPFARARAWLPPSALIVGSAAPDFAYLFDSNHLNFHVWPAALVPCVPLALGLWWLFEVLVAPWLAQLFAETWGPLAGVLVQTRGAPNTVRAWFAAALAIGVGVMTHLVWDGFTHATRWPASTLYPGVQLSIGPVTLWLTQWLQFTSHVVGAVVVVRAAARLTPSVRWFKPRFALEAGRFASVLLLCEAVSFATLVTVWPNVSRTALLGGPWLVFWWGARGLLVAVLLCAAWQRRWAMTTNEP